MRLQAWENLETTAEGHRQRAERILRSPELLSFLKPTTNSQQCPWFADDSLLERPWDRTKVCAQFCHFSRVEANPSRLTDQ